MAGTQFRCSHSMPGVGAPFISLLREYLASRGLDPEPLTGPSLAPQAAITSEAWQNMLRRSAEALAEPAFGLSLARHVTFRHLGVVGYLASSCSTLAEALQKGTRYGALIAEHNPTHIEMIDGQFRLSWPLVNGWSGQVWDELGTGTFVSMIRLVAGASFKATRVDFVAPAPADRKPYERFFGGEVRFDQPLPSLAFSADYLGMKLPGADPTLLALLDAQAEESLQKRVPLSGELQRLRHQLLHLIRDGRTRLEDLATSNDIGPRALQRRLALLGSSFQSLLDDTRRHLAEQYLGDSRLDLHEIAGLLGYSEQSSFTRAFQQWTGVTPGQWRRIRLNRAATQAPNSP